MMVGVLVVASMIVAEVEVVVSGPVSVLIHACIVDLSVITSRTSQRVVVLAAAISQLARKTVASFKHLTTKIPEVSH